MRLLKLTPFFDIKDESSIVGLFKRIKLLFLVLIHLFLISDIGRSNSIHKTTTYVKENGEEGEFIKDLNVDNASKESLDSPFNV
ncbi:hypothetical protein IEQ34_021763 [Dendrobium chrysotoxum]|uniref:Uncharacterized protein n=1 Tax=Dendrobium chrysotoxum TaxID=161865 RepID=A0AAV7G4D7_DENCH|nr:hypothetical protein IEQ34_021763 [Dendrobium chrysotoxum]